MSDQALENHTIASVLWKTEFANEADRILNQPHTHMEKLPPGEKPSEAHMERVTPLAATTKRLISFNFSQLLITHGDIATFPDSTTRATLSCFSLMLTGSNKDNHNHHKNNLNPRMVRGDVQFENNHNQSL